MIVMFKDKECMIPITSLEVVAHTNDLSDQNITLYVGSNCYRWFIHNKGDDVIFRHGQEVFNLGKIVDKATAITLSFTFENKIGREESEFTADGFTLEYLEEDCHPIAEAVFNTNKRFIVNNSLRIL